MTCSCWCACWCAWYVSRVLWVRQVRRPINFASPSMGSSRKGAGGGAPLQEKNGLALDKPKVSLATPLPRLPSPAPLLSALAVQPSWSRPCAHASPPVPGPARGVAPADLLLGIDGIIQLLAPAAHASIFLPHILPVRERSPSPPLSR